MQPDATQGRSVSAREILDSGTGNLETEWKGEATVKARLLSTLGSVYYKHGDLDMAVKLFSQSRALTATTAALASIRQTH